MVILQCCYVPQSFGASSEPGTASNTTPSTLTVSNSITESSSTALKPIVDEAGLITLSLDAKGVEDYDHANIRVNKPSAGATVRSAYLATADVAGLYGGPLDNGIVQLNGVPVTWKKQVQALNTRGFNFNNAWADVTPIIKPIADAAPEGIVNIDYTEEAYLDGSILAVIFDDPAQTVNNSVVLLFGSQNTLGDTFNIGLANPIDKSDSKLAMDFSLGISYGYQPGGQVSDVTVNGKRLTSSAGGQDEGFDADGGLITVGGIGDSNANPSDPYAGSFSSCRDDDELYNLLPFVNDGDTKIAVDTINPSNDDNIFFAGLSVSSANAIVGEGIILDPISDKGIIGNYHTVTATLQDDNGNLLANKEVKFYVISGPNKNKTAVVTTGSDGKASFTYTSLSTGIDTINASFMNSQGETVFSNNVQMEWSPSDISVASVSLNKTDTTLALGGTEQLVATVYPSNATNKNVTWVSCNPSVATVDSMGLVTAVNPGITLITVHTNDGDKTAACIVRVTESTRPVESVSLNKSATTLAEGRSERLVATVSPDDATNKDVTWTSSDTAIATVDSSGLVTALTPGTATVTVSTLDGNKQATCIITVTPSTKTVKALTANPSSLNLAIDGSDYITLTATYTDNSEEDVTQLATWASSNPQYATVDEYGKVTGVANGTANVIASFGGKTATVTVTVNDSSTPVLQDIIAQPESVSVAYGKTQAVKIYAEYSDGSKVDVTKLAALESDDPTIASVNGGTIKGLCVGNTFISVIYLDQTTEISVKVTAPLTKLTADPTVLNLAVDGSDTVTLNATYKDGTEDDVTESATWKSKNPKIATVDEYGIITGIAKGTTTITGTFGGKTANVTVNVTPELDYFLFQPSIVGVAKGKTQAVNIFAVYVDGSKVDITKSVQLTSDDPDVASVRGATIKGLLADSETIVRGTYLDQDIEIQVKVTPSLKTLEADATTLNLDVDQSETINLTAHYADGTSEDVNECAIFLSSKPSIAAVDIVDGSITVTGVAPGSTTITLSYEGKKVSVKVKVTA